MLWHPEATSNKNYRIECITIARELRIDSVLQILGYEKFKTYFKGDDNMRRCSLPAIRELVILFKRK